MILPYNFFTAGDTFDITKIRKLSEFFPEIEILPSNKPKINLSDSFNQRLKILKKIHILSAVIDDGFNKAVQEYFSSNDSKYLQKFKDASIEKVELERERLTKQLYKIKI